MTPRLFFFISLCLISLIGSGQIPYGPKHVSSVRADGALLYQPQSVFVLGSYAYVASSGSNALEIIDISDPAIPKHKSSLAINTQDSLYFYGANSVFVVGNYAYMATYNYLQIIDVSNPLTPILKGKISYKIGSNAIGAPAGVFVSGKYAYVVAGKAFEIIDISDPTAPTQKGYLPNDPSVSNDIRLSIFISGNYAYVGNAWTNALEVFDISNPLSPGLKGIIKDGDGGALLNNPFSIRVAGNYAYVASANSNALEIVDVSDPTTPHHKGSIIDGQGGAQLSLPQSVFVDGSNVFVASYFSSALEVVDITDPASPVHKGSISDGSGGAKLTGAASVFVSANRAYVASKDANSVEVVDISSPSNPQHLGKISDGDGGSGARLSGANKVAMSGNYAYVVGGYALQVVDVTNPDNPILKGSLVHGQGGAWINYGKAIFILGNYAYIASENALEIADISNPSAPIHKGALLNGSGGAKLNNPTSVFVKGSYAYLASFGSNAVEIVDVSNPSAPVHAGSIVDGAGGATLISPFSIFVSGNFAYVACWSFPSNALEIIDVSNPAIPTHKATLADGDGGAQIYLPFSVSVNGNFAYLANFESTLEIVNISDPATPVHESNLSISPDGKIYYSPTSIFLNGKYAFISSYSSLEVVDISSPSKPIYLAHLGDGVGGALLDGANSVVVSNGYAFIASQNDNALEIVSIYTPATPVATPASSVSSSGFTANWNSAAGATSYELDVSTDNFKTFVTGFNSLSVSGTSKSITNLNAASSYQYRVRSVNSYGTSLSSNQISVTTDKLSQTITFGSISDKTVGDPAFTLAASSDSGLDISYSTGSTRITISGTSVTIVSAGRDTITAAQSGNSLYKSAVKVSQTFCVKPKAPTLTIDASDPSKPILTSSASVGNQWYFNGTAIAGANEQIYKALEAGAYKVQTHVDDCFSNFSADAAVTITGDILSHTNLSVYPNPAGEKIKVLGVNGSDFSPQLFDATGQMIAVEFEKDDEAYQADINNLTPGLYIVKIVEQNSVHHIKFLKK
ncbi:MAG: T9SS type A sorting domain-containing protein [Bacteroidetes bacterium]|nr:T9SS type A sorting domain-containing protein [Bacteroidota bacterium]